MTDRTTTTEESPTAVAPRLLFRYITVEEWGDYRAIVSVFAGTFFREFTPEEVAIALAENGWPIDDGVVVDRLDRLCEWGNLTLSATVGNPTSLADYYRRRNRYLITRAGQEVHDVVEGVLQRVDEVRDVSVSRLGALLSALEHLASLDAERADAAALAEAVRAVFDPHLAFTTEITQFFASLNQWQSRFDLDPDEFSFFAEVLIGYVGDRLTEIERRARPIGRALDIVLPDIDIIAIRAKDGLAARVADAGIKGVTVVRAQGSAALDWHNLRRWFVDSPTVPSRIETLSNQAISAIHTLTQNLTRLSRTGVGISSRRADYLRLANSFASNDEGAGHRIAAAAFGLHAACHFGMLSGDSNDPVPAITSWLDAPRARVPVAIRERGNTAMRGATSPMPDRSREKRLLHDRRRQLEEGRRRVDVELAGFGERPDVVLSSAALVRLEELLGLATATMTPSDEQIEVTDGGMRIVVHRKPNNDTLVTSVDGTLVLFDLAFDLTVTH